MVELCTPPPSSWTSAKHVRLAGVEPAALLQSPEFPAGGSPGLGALVKIDGWQGNVPGPPGGKWLVSGRVLAREIDRQGGAAPPAFFTADGDPASLGTAQQSAATSVKLRVQRCDFPEDHVLVDSDSHVVVDSGQRISVDVMAPPSWVALPVTDPDLLPPENGLYVSVRFTVCPLTCCWPPSGRLTWWNDAPVDGDVLVRPNRAGKWQVWGPVPAGSVWRGLRQAGVLGSQQLNGGFTNTDLRAGGVARFELVSGGGAGPMHWVWEID